MMFEQNEAMWSRYLTELTLGFHIIFATIGVGIPLMIALAQWIGIKRNDPHYLLLARRWTRGFVITVAVGVVTGTAIGLQLSLLWPKFMEIAGQIIALPLFMETFAFFFEAIFLGIYIYTWNRFKNPMRHFLLLIPVAIGASMSAFFITTVNSFMNAPQGFEMVDFIAIQLKTIATLFTLNKKHFSSNSKQTPVVTDKKVSQRVNKQTFIPSGCEMGGDRYLVPN